jgi:hypothetical protein
MMVRDSTDNSEEPDPAKGERFVAAVLALLNIPF